MIDDPRIVAAADQAYAGLKDAGAVVKCQEPGCPGYHATADALLAAALLLDHVAIELAAPAPELAGHLQGTSVALLNLWLHQQQPSP